MKRYYRKFSVGNRLSIKIKREKNKEEGEEMTLCFRVNCNNTFGTRCGRQEEAQL